MSETNCENLKWKSSLTSSRYQIFQSTQGLGRPYHFNFLKAVFHKFYLVYSWIPWLTWGVAFACSDMELIFPNLSESYFLSNTHCLRYCTVNMVFEINLIRPILPNLQKVNIGIKIEPNQIKNWREYHGISKNCEMHDFHKSAITVYTHPQILSS